MKEGSWDNMEYQQGSRAEMTILNFKLKLISVNNGSSYFDGRRHCHRNLVSRHKPSPGQMEYQ